MLRGGRGNRRAARNSYVPLPSMAISEHPGAGPSMSPFRATTNNSPLTIDALWRIANEAADFAALRAFVPRRAFASRPVAETAEAANRARTMVNFINIGV